MVIHTLCALITVAMGNQKPEFIAPSLNPVYGRHSKAGGRDQPKTSSYNPKNRRFLEKSNRRR